MVGKITLVVNIDQGDFTKGYAFKRTHGLKPVVFTDKKNSRKLVLAGIQSVSD
jgi:hypothetical protein